MTGVGLWAKNATGAFDPEATTMRAISISATLILTALLATAATSAEPAGQVYRLAPEEIAKLADAPPAPFDPLFDRSLYDGVQQKRDRAVHGEIGAFVGSGGARGLFGTAEVPIGDRGFASFSFEDSRTDDRGYRRRR